MATIERRIDALGGVYSNSQQDQAYVGGYNAGYAEALERAMEIGAEADAQIEELIDWVEDVLNGRCGFLEKWAESARTTVTNMKSARNR